ncbi:MAG: hypothetical protein Q7U72_11260 [Brevundimonas sp.]|uniref:hypothetical protein n=1 Tax=Brevundimonas sp. TaxID=1871086 RepID=UPI0027230059|nr:hypothetical protein [Brevundimonas sp.]MDO9078009.1 hypothetical protein [Brevundimonas sp.]MDP3080822.1 hypothetical protein [Brevundimonas sp.]MDZ4062516.1 hypothetical protein [Brevundimonas sp.]
MIFALLLVVLMQDGPVQTNPSASTVDLSAYAEVVRAREAQAATVPAPVCTFGRRPISRPGCPTPPGPVAADPDAEVPAWALPDPARWELSQCGAAGDDACRRRARNRLAMARAGVAAEVPTEAAGAGAAAQNCRMVMRRSDNGFGGSLSRICGDQSEAEATLNRLEDSLRPAIEPCDRPATLESQDAWIARCRALPPR